MARVPHPPQGVKIRPGRLGCRAPCADTIGSLPPPRGQEPPPTLIFTTVGFMLPIRIAVLVILAVTRPLAPGCRAPRPTAVGAKLWWRSLIGCPTIPLLQLLDLDFGDTIPRDCRSARERACLRCHGLPPRPPGSGRVGCPRNPAYARHRALTATATPWGGSHLHATGAAARANAATGPPEQR
jgi:hypothetical protein